MTAPEFKGASTLEAFAEAATFPASDRSAAITGTVADLNGGLIVD
ncbi:hypothetical protein [Glycomyces algeriensis]|nr:hypothetical protein [Glycomyces algeriensis]MDA1365662.1 hypothetical protein [Glycomyces algeriensis]MDR7351350.1 hypothetical protein [Glycomyces algeriensis]